MDDDLPIWFKLKKLGLSDEEFSDILSVAPRTVYRWTNDLTKTPTAVMLLLDTWIHLRNLGLAWRPNHCIIESCDQRMGRDIGRIEYYNEHIERTVEEKKYSGTNFQWEVNLKKELAFFGPFQVCFYENPEDKNGFSIVSYTRTDKKPNFELDKPFLEDAIFYINKELESKEEK